ncbi:hypothetical protein OCU04_007863 [Sclerotinia nivalis]|uniref:Uncharacterized protein n=1 Tax=Sclerotinia nivalis TaxID=352851 RepID=A0A9X0DJK5_9HELO|nr:hypothetical protein OCU04_007863 [Sclerotinia nivalis]
MIVPKGEVSVEEKDRWVDDGTRQRCKWWGEARYWDGYQGDREDSVKRKGGGNRHGRGQEKSWRKNDAEGKIKNKEATLPKLDEGASSKAKGNGKNDEKSVEWHAQ